MKNHPNNNTDTQTLKGGMGESNFLISKNQGVEQQLYIFKKLVIMRYKPT